MDFDREACLASFLVESQESLDSMEQSLLDLESGTSATDVLQDIFRVGYASKHPVGN